MGWFDGTSSVSREYGTSRASVSRDGWVRKRSPHRSSSIYSSRHSRHSAPSIFSLGGVSRNRSSSSIFGGGSRHRTGSSFFGGGGDRNRSTSSFFSTSSWSRHGVRPRSGFIERLIRRVKRLLREIYYYARRHPIRVFLLVIVPLIAGGVLQRLLGMVGLRLPNELMGNRSNFQQISRGVYGEMGGGSSSGLQDSVKGLMTVAKWFI